MNFFCASGNIGMSCGLIFLDQVCSCSQQRTFPSSTWFQREPNLSPGTLTYRTVICLDIFSSHNSFVKNCNISQSIINGTELAVLKKTVNGDSSWMEMLPVKFCWDQYCKTAIKNFHYCFENTYKISAFKMPICHRLEEHKKRTIKCWLWTIYVAQ